MASQAALARTYKVVEPHAVLEIADGILDFGVATMIGLQIQGVSPFLSVMKA